MIIMQCPTCYTQNMMGAEECSACMFPLAGLDRPAPQDRIEGSIMFDEVEKMKPRWPVTVPGTMRLGDVMQHMILANVGAVLVTNGDNELVGILTERDFLTKLATRTDFHRLPVSDFMSSSPEVVSTSDPLAFALGKMVAGGYRHIPVVDEGQPLGMISVRDALKHIVQICRDG